MAQRKTIAALVAALGCWLPASPAGANGFALRAYGVPGSDALCENGRAEWSNGTKTGTIGQGAGYAYADVSGKVNITAIPTDDNIEVTWSSQDGSWNVSSGCGAGSLSCVVINGNYVDVNFGEPLPTLTTISPTGCEVGSPDLELTVTSDEATFTHQSVVSFDGEALATTFVSTSQLTAKVPEAPLAGPRTVEVTVQNPVAPAFGSNCGTAGRGACPSVNGGTSNALDFAIVFPPPDASTPPPDAAAPGEDAAEPGEDAAAPGPDAAEPGPDASEPPDAAEPADAEVPPDAAATPADAASPSTDSGEGPDAGEPAVDAAEPDDAASPAQPADAAIAIADGGGADASSSEDPVYDLGGCGCHTGGSAAGLATLAALALAGRPRRRGR